MWVWANRPIGMKVNCPLIYFTLISNEHKNAKNVAEIKTMSIVWIQGCQSYTYVRKNAQRTCTNKQIVHRTHTELYEITDTSNIWVENMDDYRIDE